eukprot:11344388-Karenia_brevis.AAC.1
MPYTNKFGPLQFSAQGAQGITGPAGSGTTHTGGQMPAGMMSIGYDPRQCATNYSSTPQYGPQAKGES